MLAELEQPSGRLTSARINIMTQNQQDTNTQVSSTSKEDHSDRKQKYSFDSIINHALSVHDSVNNIM